MKIRKRLKSTANYIIIFIMIIFGFIGIIVPIIPGIFFFAVALIILSFEIQYIEDKLLKHVDINTNFGKMFFKIRTKIERFFR